MNVVDLTVTYDKSVALNIPKLHINDKEKVCVIGKSGSGKSTFIKAIFDLVPYDGHIDIDVSNVSYLPQDSDLVKGLKVKTNIEIMKFQNKGVIHNIKSLYIKNEEVDSLLKALDIYDKKDAKVSTLSGGEVQRVLIARTIYENKAINILDEPTSALDVQNSNKAISLLLQELVDKTVICIIHDLTLVKYFDRVLIFSDSEIIKDCSTASLSEAEVCEYFDE